VSNLTLEDVAQVLEFRETLISPARQRYTALVRAAQAVIDEARPHSCEQHLMGTTTIHCAMCNALAEFDRLSAAPASEGRKEPY
jgi:hypothetical protein